MFGLASSTGANLTSTGVYGYSLGSSGTGVLGAGNKFGVVGQALNLGNGSAGVYGVAGNGALPVFSTVAGVVGAATSANSPGGFFQNQSGAPLAKIFVAEDAQIPRFTVDNSGNVSVTVGATQPVTVSLPVNHARGPVSGQGFVTATLNWAFPFPDTNYTVTCTDYEQGGWNSDVGPLIAVIDQEAASVTVETFMGLSDPQVVIHCLAVHD